MSYVKTEGGPTGQGPLLGGSGNITNMYIGVNTVFNQKAAKKAQKQSKKAAKKMSRTWRIFTFEMTRSVFWKMSETIQRLGSLISRVLVAPLQGATLAAREFGKVIGSSVKAAQTRMITTARLNTLTRGKGEETMQDLEGFVLGTNKNQKFFTSHEMSRVQAWASTLLASGMEWNKAKEWIGRLNDIFGADTDAMSRMAFNIGQIKAADRAYGLDIRQFGTAGFPIKEYLSKYFAVPVGEVADLVSKGAVDYKAIEAAIFKATNKGGRYEGGTQATLATTPGRLSQLKGRWQVYTAQMGYPIVEGLYDIILWATEKIKEIQPQFKELGEALTDLMLRLFRAFKFLTGDMDASGGLSWFAKQIKHFGNTVELLIYDLFGIPKDLQDQGFTKGAVRKESKSGLLNYLEMLKDYTTSFWEKIHAPVLGFAADIGVTIGESAAKAIWEWMFGKSKTPEEVAEQKKKDAKLLPSVAGIQGMGSPMMDFSALIKKKAVVPDTYAKEYEKNQTETVHKMFKSGQSSSKVRKVLDDESELAPTDPEADMKGTTKPVISNSFTIYTDDTKDTVLSEITNARLEFQQMEAVV